MIDHRQTELFGFWSSIILAHLGVLFLVLGASFIGGFLTAFWGVVALYSGYRILNWYGGF